jgi:hypothetical protein
MRANPTVGIKQCDAGDGGDQHNTPADEVEYPKPLDMMVLGLSQCCAESRLETEMSAPVEDLPPAGLDEPDQVLATGVLIAIPPPLQPAHRAQRGIDFRCRGQGWRCSWTSNPE